MITDATDRICTKIRTDGSTESHEISGEIDAEAAGLAKRFAELGIKGPASLKGKNTSTCLNRTSQIL